jgi:hypothetical protein
MVARCSHLCFAPEGVLWGTAPGVAAVYQFTRTNELRARTNEVDGRSEPRESTMKHVQFSRTAAKQSLTKTDKCETLSDTDLDKVAGGAIDSYMYFTDYNQTYRTK